MLTEIAVAVDLASLERAKNGQISGRICADFGGQPFPERNWSDLVVVILGDWLQASRAFTTERSASIDLCFLDGPFLLRMHRAGPELLAITPVSHSSTTAAINARLVRESDWSDALVLSSKGVLEECRRRSWTSREVIRLDSLVRSAPK